MNAASSFSWPNALAIFGRRHRRGAGVTRHPGPLPHRPTFAATIYGASTAHSSMAFRQGGRPVTAPVPSPPPSDPHAAEARGLFPIA
jgi:hypothetical protein